MLQLLVAVAAFFAALLAKELRRRRQMLTDLPVPNNLDCLLPDNWVHCLALTRPSLRWERISVFTQYFDLPP
jgi:hypothetical protein